MTFSLLKNCSSAISIQRSLNNSCIYSFSSRILLSSIYEKSKINLKSTPSSFSAVDRKIFFSALSRSPKFNQINSKNSSYSSNISLTKKHSSDKNVNLYAKARKIRSNWSEEETQKLLKFVSENGREWTEAARYLGTNRPPISCSTYYDRITNNSLLKGKWSKEEEEKLVYIIKNDISLIEKKKYAEISSLLGNGRTSLSVRIKIINYPHSINLLEIVKNRDKINSNEGKNLENRLSSLKRSNWSKEETALLNYAMEIAGENLKVINVVHPSSEAISQEFVNESYDLIKTHNRKLKSSYKYLSKLFPMTDQLLKSKQKEILDLLKKKNGNKKRVTWADISEFVSSRTINQCQNKWTQLIAL
ncbi:Myb-like protein L [Smittium culicis]|uniref:Myb-like protein L n=1 Tax=Smittium culicis TaxID=133412 RepID=A0A1R1XAB9_9FUNG|nr:Myb-like protein L [Smittium culicis]